MCSFIHHKILPPVPSPVNPSISQPVRLIICSSIRPFVVRQSISLSIHYPSAINFSLCVSICSSVCPSFGLTISPSVQSQHMVFSHVLHDITPSFVGPSVHQSVGPSIGPSHYIFIIRQVLYSHSKSF